MNILQGGEHGLLFLAYSNSPKKFDVLLDRMVGTHSGPDGVCRCVCVCVCVCVCAGVCIFKFML